MDGNVTEGGSPSRAGTPGGTKRRKRKKRKKSKSLIRPTTIALVFLGVLVVWFVAGFGGFWLAGFFKSRASAPAGNFADTGPFGDTFGFVNSLFSALGVAGVALALIFQAQDRREQRELASEGMANDRILAMLAAMIHGESEMQGTARAELEVIRQMMVDEARTPEQRKELTRLFVRISDGLATRYQRFADLIAYAEILFADHEHLLRPILRDRQKRTGGASEGQPPGPSTRPDLDPSSIPSDRA